VCGCLRTQTQCTLNYLGNYEDQIFEQLTKTDNSKPTYTEPQTYNKPVVYLLHT